MLKQTRINWIKDKSILIISAVIIAIILLTFIYIMKDYIHVSDGWLFFILFCVLYVAIVIYEYFPIIRGKRRKILLFSLLCGSQAIVIILMFLLFYFNLIKLPEKGILIYGFAFTGVAMLTVTIYSFLVKKIE